LDSSHDDETGLPIPRRFVAILALVTGILVMVSNTTAIALALPVITDEFAIAPSTAIWVVSAFQIAVVMLILPSSALGERIGHTRMFRTGIILFVIGSALCALSQSLWWLIAARMLQGAGTAATMSVSGALLRDIYPRSMLGAAVSVNAFTVATAGGLGPVVGSLILSFASWPYLFVATIPIGLLSLGLSLAMPDNDARPVRVDARGGLINAVAFGAFLVGVLQIGTRGDLAMAMLVLSGLAFVRLGFHVRGTPNAIIPLDLLAIPHLSLASAISGFTFATSAAILTSFPFYLLHDLGVSTIQAGAVLAIWPATVAVAAVAGGWLSDYLRAERLVLAGTSVVAGGLFLVVATPVGASLGPIMVAMGVMGAGFGFFQTPNNRILIAIPPRNRRIRAAGLQSMSREFGHAVGIGLVGLGFSVAASAGAHVGLIVAAVLAGVAAVLSLVRLLVPSGDHGF